MIQAENLHKRFGALDVLTGATLEVRDGETLAIIGRSGSGKSVLLKHLVGLLTPDEGRVLVDGTDINAISYEHLRTLRHQFGVLFQGGALFDSMTALGNVAFPLRTFTDEPEEEVRRRAEEALARVRLQGTAPKKPAALSGGQRKRVALARAIALEPRYLLYDEPTCGLDPQTSNTINDLINDLAEDLNITSIVITHDMHSVLAIADRAALIHDGVIHWSGPTGAFAESDDEVLLDFVRANEYQIGVPSPTSKNGARERNGEKQLAGGVPVS